MSFQVSVDQACLFILFCILKPMLNLKLCSHY